MNHHPAPTIRDIAQRCGVTAATVSRVLNRNYSNNFSASKELQDQVFRVSEELGYRPNFVAKNLAQHKTSVIGIIGKDTVFGWPSDIYRKTVEAAICFFQSHRYEVFSFAPNLKRDEVELPPWHVDGILMIQDFSSRTIDEMERRQLPGRSVIFRVLWSP